MWSKILILGLLPAAMAFAQRHEDPSGGMLAQRQTQLDQFADKLKLNKEQRTQAESIMDAAREAMGPAQEKLIEVRKNLAAALIEGKTGDPVDKLNKDYAALSAQAKQLEAGAFAKICALLKPNQQSRAVQNFALMAQLVESGRMGGPAAAPQQGQWNGGRGGGRR